MKYANIYQSVAAIFRDDMFLDETDFFNVNCILSCLL